MASYSFFPSSSYSVVHGFFMINEACFLCAHILFPHVCKEPKDQTLQPCKVTNLEIPTKNLKKSGDLVKNLEILAGYIFRSDIFKEHFK